MTTAKAFAVVIIAIKSFGGVVGWGFQFQHPPFIIFMCALLFLFALNLLGAFEISMPGIQTGVQEEESLGGSVFEGFLARKPSKTLPPNDSSSWTPVWMPGILISKAPKRFKAKRNSNAHIKIMKGGC